MDMICGLKFEEIDNKYGRLHDNGIDYLEARIPK